jgi:hypothetical protein
MVVRMTVHLRRLDDQHRRRLLAEAIARIQNKVGVFLGHAILQRTSTSPSNSVLLRFPGLPNV